MQLHVLIPAYNEADYLAETLACLPQTELAMQVLVVDDGSTDATSAVAQHAGVKLLRLEQKAGKGAALNAGCSELLKTADISTDLLLLLDADIGTSADKASALLTPLLEDQADLVIAQLPSPPGSGGFGLVKNLGRKAIAELGGGWQAQAPLSGQRALRVCCLDRLMPFADGYGVEVAMTIRALQAGYRVLELPVAFRHRFSGHTLSGFIHRGRQYFDLRRTIRELKNPKHN